MRVLEQIDEAYALLQKGDVIAYPTEAVYGLGCDAFNADAVSRILTLKRRSETKGLIVLIANWEQLWPLIDKDKIPKARLDAVKQTWPGFVTWVFPKSNRVPAGISGAHDGIAIRMTAHPVAHALCKHGPIVSTSANLSGASPVRHLKDLMRFFPEGVSGVVAGELGEHFAVSEIYNILDGSTLRG